MNVRYIALGIFAGCLIELAAGAATPNQDKPASVHSLPGDNLPHFMMLDDSGKLIPPPPTPPGGYHRAKGAESTVPGPSLDLAETAARAAVNYCVSKGFNGAATVVDSIGHARAMLSADGADGSHVFVAHRKALTSLIFKMSSADARKLVPNDPALLRQVTPSMFVQFGAFPIMHGNEVIGAIGYSGGDDEACAKAGLAAIEKVLLDSPSNKGSF